MTPLQEQIDRIFSYIQIYSSSVNSTITKLDIEVVIQKVILYCNMTDDTGAMAEVIPTELEKIVAKTMSKLYLVYSTDVARITEGDTTIDFGSYVINEETNFNTLKPFLFSYRRLYQ